MGDKEHWKKLLIQSTLHIVNTICSSILFTIWRGSLHRETIPMNLHWSVSPKLFTIWRRSLYRVLTIWRIDWTFSNYNSKSQIFFFSNLSTALLTGASSVLSCDVSLSSSAISVLHMNIMSVLDIPSDLSSPTLGVCLELSSSVLQVSESIN